MWRGYHQLIIGDELSSLWHSTLERVFSAVYAARDKKGDGWGGEVSICVRRSRDCLARSSALEGREEQALRYVAGYIPMKLKKKYEKRPDSVRALKYMECLNTMNEEKGADVDFLQYTKLWVEQVNRGGLFRVTNDTYLIFRAIKLASRRVLSVKRVTSHPTLEIQREMEESIMKDPSVTAHWNYLLTKVEAFDSDESDELLGEIVDKWVKIRATHLQVRGLSNTR